MKIFYFFYKNKKTFKIKKKIKYNYSIIKYNYKISNYFLGWNIFLKNGLKLKINSVFNNYFFLFYFYLTKNTYITKNFDYINEIKSIIFDNNIFKNPINLLNWYFSYFVFIFNVKNDSSILKKKKNINKNSNVLKLNFIQKKQRNLYFFKWLKQMMLIKYIYNFKKLLFFLLNDIFLNFKSSNFYKYKLLLYKKLLFN